MFIFSSIDIRLLLVNDLRSASASEMYRFAEIKCLVFDTVGELVIYPNTEKMISECPANIQMYRLRKARLDVHFT